MLFLMPLINKLNDSTNQAQTYKDMLNMEAITKEFKSVINAPEVKKNFSNESNTIGASIDAVMSVVNKFKMQPTISESDFESLSIKFKEFKTRMTDFAEKLVDFAPKIKSLENVGNPIYSNLLDRHPSTR